MSQSLVQTGAKITVSGGTSGSVTLNGVGAGHLLTASAIDDAHGRSTFRCADNLGNSWSSAVLLNNDTSMPNGSVQILYARNVAPGNTTVTVTDSNSSSFTALVQEWSGSDPTAPLAATDSFQQNNSSGTAQSASSTGISPGAACICLVTGTSQFSGVTQAAGSGYTLASLNAWDIVEHQVFGSAPTAEKGEWTTQNGTKTFSVIAAFKAGGASPPRAGALIGGEVGGML